MVERRTNNEKKKKVALQNHNESTAAHTRSSSKKKTNPNIRPAISYIHPHIYFLSPSKNATSCPTGTFLPITGLGIAIGFKLSLLCRLNTSGSTNLVPPAVPLIIPSPVPLLSRSLDLERSFGLRGATEGIPDEDEDEVEVGVWMFENMLAEALWDPEIFENPYADWALMRLLPLPLLLLIDNLDKGEGDSSERIGVGL